MPFTNALVSATPTPVPPISTLESRSFNELCSLSLAIWWCGAGMWELYSDRRTTSFSASCVQDRRLETTMLPIGHVEDTLGSIVTSRVIFVQDVCPFARGRLA